MRRLEARGDTSIRGLVEGVRALPPIEPAPASQAERVSEALAEELERLPEPVPQAPAPPAPVDENRGRWPTANDIPPVSRGFGWGYGEGES